MDRSSTSPIRPLAAAHSPRCGWTALSPRGRPSQTVHWLMATRIRVMVRRTSKPPRMRAAPPFNVRCSGTAVQGPPCKVRRARSAVQGPPCKVRRARSSTSREGILAPWLTDNFRVDAETRERPRFAAPDHRTAKRGARAAPPGPLASTLRERRTDAGQAWTPGTLRHRSTPSSSPQTCLSGAYRHLLGQIRRTRVFRMGSSWPTRGWGTGRAWAVAGPWRRAGGAGAPGVAGGGRRHWQGRRAWRGVGRRAGSRARCDRANVAHRLTAPGRRTRS